jgi:hypothetical protein
VSQLQKFARHRCRSRQKTVPFKEFEDLREAARSFRYNGSGMVDIARGR